jgi:DNA topoisomerase VI subunit B
LEFFAEKELQLQIGQPAYRWPIAILKERVDNALDACETARVQPEITVEVTPDTLTVIDNGPGMPAETITRSLDYAVRVSDKAYYASPTRGQLGNALKCVWLQRSSQAGGWAGRGRSGDVRYMITVRLDRIAQAPAIDLTGEPTHDVKTGTSITVQWRGLASYLNRWVRPVLTRGSLPPTSCSLPIPPSTRMRDSPFIMRTRLS